MKFLTTPKELDSHLDHFKLLVIDSSPFSKYSHGRIPGAINIVLFQFHWIDTSEIGTRARTRKQVLNYARHIALN